MGEDGCAYSSCKSQQVGGPDSQREKLSHQESQEKSHSALSYDCRLFTRAP